MFRIQHLQWLGIAAAAIGCVLLGGAAVLSNYSDHQRHSRGVTELERYIVLLDAVNAVSAERGPANSAMGATDAESPELLAALTAKRETTDAALAAMESLFAADLSVTDGHAALEALRTGLTEGRAKVDIAATTPFANREPILIANGIMGMFAAADRAGDLRDLVSGQIIEDTPQLAGEVILANSASALRDYEGRLGSFAVAVLVAPPERDQLYIQRMRGAEGIIHTLWSNSVGMADKLLPDPEITALLADVRRDFFETGLTIAQKAVDEHGADNSLSAAELAVEYVPILQSSEKLRSAIVDHSIRNLQQDAAKALGALINSGALTLGILAVLVIVAILFRRTLFAPLMRLHGDVLALANGDHDAPPPVNAVAREVDDIFAGIAVLRQHLSEKRVLEEEQRRLNRRLRRLAETDTLTGLLNRRALLSRVDAVFRRADRLGESLAVVLFDIDFFKQVNDTHGHAVGDEVLAGVARLIDGTLRTGDTLARIGGEEFVIILRHMDELTAYNRVERMRLLLADSPVQSKLGLKVTASFGMAMRPSDSGIDWDAIFSLADQRLYLAKNSGRNRVVIDGMSPETRRRA